MLGLTTHISTDLAAIPLLWVLPLAAYLLTFILAFSTRVWISERLLASAVPVSALAVMLSIIFQRHAPWIISVHVVAFFLLHWAVILRWYGRARTQSTSPSSMCGCRSAACLAASSTRSLRRSCLTESSSTQSSWRSRVWLDHRPDSGADEALHISNRFLRLEPVVAAVVAATGLRGLSELEDLIPAADAVHGRYQSHWVVITTSQERFTALGAQPRWRPLRSDARVSAWTDDYSNLLTSIQW